METLLVAVPVQAASRALQGNIYPEVPAQHALQEPTQRQQLRLSAQLALLASHHLLEATHLRIALIVLLVFTQQEAVARA